MNTGFFITSEGSRFPLDQQLNIGMVEKWNIDELVKSQCDVLASFRQKPESSKINIFWMPDQVRHDDSRTFYETINIGYEKRMMA
jgi:hypothetical protein